MKKKLIYILVFLLCCTLLTPVQATENEIQKIVERMTLKQKIAQTFLVDFSSWNGQALTTMSDDLADILAEYNFGGMILFAPNVQDSLETLQLTQDIQKAATRDGGIPMFISIDQEGGIVRRLGDGTNLPGNMAIGATNDAKYAKSAGKIVGSELASLGINVDLAPVVDINNNANNPIIGLRSYGDDPAMVAMYARGFIDGLDEYNIIGCAKHFPGHGNTSTDSHTSLPTVERSKEEIRNTELVPYQELINTGLDMIMTAHILFPSLDDTMVYSTKTGKQEPRPATISYKIITELLKEEMGFEGVVCSDAMNMGGVSDTFDETQVVVEALKAGMDLMCMPASGIYSVAGLARVDAIIQSVVDAIDSGYLDEARLDDAVTRILTLKQKRNILNWEPDMLSEKVALNTVGSKENKQLEMEISTSAVTVIENKKKTLPLKLEDETHVLFLYPYDYQEAYMLKGWKEVKKAGLVGEDVVLETYQYYRENYEIIGTLRNAINRADIVIVNSCVSSDNSMLYSTWTAAGPNTIVNYCKENGKKSIVVSVDKPYDVQLYKNADAILAVYGDEINLTAAIEVIAGLQGAKGKLSLDIPLFDNDTGLYTDETVYERGYGLTYNSFFGPETPEFYTVTTNQKGVSLTWSKVDNVTSYTLYRNNKAIYEGKDQQYIDEDIQAGQEYTYAIEAKDTTGISDQNTYSIYYIPDIDFNIYHQLFNDIKLSWSKMDGIDGYEIRYSTGNQTVKQVFDHPDMDSLLLNDLTKNTTYTISIRAYKELNGKKYYSNWISKDVKTHTWIWF